MYQLCSENITTNLVRSYTIVRELLGRDRLRTASQFAIRDVDLLSVSKFGFFGVGIEYGDDEIIDERVDEELLVN